MSKGVPYTQQSYKVCSGFHEAYEWIRNKARFLFLNLSMKTMIHVMICACDLLCNFSDLMPPLQCVLQWNEGFFVTAAGTAQNSWAIVMSKGTPFLQQVRGWLWLALPDCLPD